VRVEEPAYPETRRARRHSAISLPPSRRPRADGAGFPNNGTRLRHTATGISEVTAAEVRDVRTVCAVVASLCSWEL
jgi:hypothetical protein